MEIVLTVKTGKGLKSTSKDVGKTVDVLVPLLEDFVDEKGCIWKDCVCSQDETSIILAKL